MLISNILAAALLTSVSASPFAGREGNKKHGHRPERKHGSKGGKGEDHHKYGDKMWRGTSDKECLKIIANTYLTNLTQVSPKPASKVVTRGLLTLNSDATVSASNSNQGGLAGTADIALQSYGSSRGVWECKSKLKDECKEEDRGKEWCNDYHIEAITLNFRYATGYLPATVADSTYNLKYDGKRKTLSGSKVSSYYPLYNTVFDQGSKKYKVPNAQIYNYTYSGLPVTLEGCHGHGGRPYSKPKGMKDESSGSDSTETETDTESEHSRSETSASDTDTDTDKSH